MKRLWGLRRWWVRRFRTSVHPAQYNRHGGRILTAGEWEVQGGWDGALVSGWHVERPDWWKRGSRSGVTDETAKLAEMRLDEWQDDMARREAA